MPSGPGSTSGGAGQSSSGTRQKERSGGSYSWGDDRFTLYTEVSGDTAIADFGACYNLKGTAGFRVRF